MFNGPRAVDLIDRWEARPTWPIPPTPDGVEFYNGEIVHIDELVGPFRYERPNGDGSNAAPCEGQLLLWGPPAGSGVHYSHGDRPCIITEHLHPALEHSWEFSSLRRRLAGTPIVAPLYPHSYHKLRHGPRGGDKRAIQLGDDE